ncbi:MAG TPA: glycosyl hydrolase family 18 protein [Rhabdochlamydiaceae bacterium]|nr:glycosyl hydrolase family 18 protein [Rhabdochlamydiaceae bacterium]
MLRRGLLFLMLLICPIIYSSNLEAAVPQPPYTSQVVSDYIWQVLLPELQTNMSKYSSLQAYQNAVLQLQTLYQQATVETSSTQLGIILNKCIALADPDQMPTPPDVQKAQEIETNAKNIQTSIGQTITNFQNGISSSNQTLSSFSAQIANLQQIIAKTTPTQKTLNDLQKAQSDLSQAGSQLSQLQNQNSSLAQVSNNVTGQVQQISSLAQQIINGNDPNSANLTRLQTLFATLSSTQTGFQQGLQKMVTQQLASLNTLTGVTLPNDIATLEADIHITPPPPPPPSSSKIGCYIDMGSLSAQLWNFMEYYPVQQLNMTKYGQYLNSLFTQLTQSGINLVFLSFAQLSGIDSLLAGGANASSDDVIGQMMVTFPGALQAFIQSAHQNGINVNLSFGGENGSSMKIVGSNETASGQAQKLVQFMQSFQIDSVDFDFESTQFTTANSPQDAVSFFTALHQGLKALNKTLALTIMGSLSDWPRNFLKMLFYDQNGNLIFFSLFDELNLMLYSQTQYYIDANNVSWGIEQWLDLLGTKNSASAIHIGFEDAVNYASPSASAGGMYVLDTTNPGTAAAEIYKQLQQKLAQDGYASNLGEPFFWPDINHVAKGTWSRYAPITTGGMITVNFDTDVMQAFYAKLNNQ